MGRSATGGRLLLFLVLVALGAAGLAAKRHWRAEAIPPRDDGLTRLDRPLPLPDFRLRATTGAAFTPASLRGRWSLLFFGYTHCPDVCPATLKVLQSVQDRLQARRPSPQLVFVTVDPARDDVATLARYLGYFDEAAVGVTGARAELAKLRRALGVYVEKSESRTAAGYLFAHTDRLFLIDPRGQVVALLSDRRDGRRLARVIGALMERG